MRNVNRIYLAGAMFAAALFVGAVAGAVRYQTAHPGNVLVDGLLYVKSTIQSAGGFIITTITGANGDTIDNATDATWTFASNSATGPTLMCKDSAGASNCTIDTTGAGAMTFGSADVTSITLVTDGTGTAEVVLPDGSIGAAEILDGSVIGADLANPVVFSTTKTFDLGDSVVFELGDNAGVSEFTISDSGSVGVATIDSNGVLACVDVSVTGTVGAATLSAGDFNVTFSDIGNVDAALFTLDDTSDEPNAFAFQLPAGGDGSFMILDDASTRIFGANDGAISAHIPFVMTEPNQSPLELPGDVLDAGIGVTAESSSATASSALVRATINNSAGIAISSAAMTGVDVAVTANALDSGGNYNAVKVQNVTQTGAATFSALVIGTGWDVDLSLADDTALITHNGATSLSLDSTNGYVQVESVRLTGGVVGPVAQSMTIADSGDGNPAADTLTPTSSIVLITCNDTHGCNVTMGEGGAAGIVQIVNASANVANFSDSAGVSELTAAAALGQYDSLSLVYASDRWVETSRSDN